jgi:hypothetical protein
MAAASIQSLVAGAWLKFSARLSTPHAFGWLRGELRQLGCAKGAAAPGGRRAQPRGPDVHVPIGRPIADPRGRPLFRRLVPHTPGVKNCLVDHFHGMQPRAGNATEN